MNNGTKFYEGNFASSTQLGNTNSQLEQIANEVEIAKQAYSGSPKGTYATALALQTVLPTGDAGIYVVLADGKWYYWNGSSWTAGGVYQAASIAAGSIAQEKTNFVTTGKQLVNKDALSSGFFVAPATGLLTANASYFTTDYIPVTAGLTYMISHYNGFMAYYNSEKVYVTTTAEPSASDGNRTFTVPVGASYIRISSKNTFLANYQVELGISSTAVETYYLKIDKQTVLSSNIKNLNVTKEKIAKNTISRHSTEFISNDKNLYNPLYTTDGVILSAANGTTSANATYFTSDFIDIFPSESYTLGYYTGFACFYDKDKTFLSSISGGVQGNSYTFTAPLTAYYIRTSHNTNWGITKHSIVLSRGNTAIKSLGYDLLNKNIMANRSYNSRRSIKSIISKIVLSDRTMKIKLLGDSITHGQGGTGFAQDGDLIITWSGTPFYRNPNGYCWANLFKTYLEDKFDCTVTNNGVVGLNSYYMLQYISELISADDDIVICMIGTNDREVLSLATAYAQYQKIYEYCYTRGIDIIFMASSPATVAKETTPFHMEDINNLYNLLSEYTGYDYVSLFNKFNQYCRTKGVALSTLLGDGLHPNDSGYLLMYQMILEEIGFGSKVDGATW